MSTLTNHSLSLKNPHHNKVLLIIINSIINFVILTSNPTNAR